MIKQDSNLELAKRRINTAKIENNERNHLFNYMISCNIGDNMKKKSFRTINNEILNLCKFSEYMNKPLREVTKDDIKRFVFYLTEEKKLAKSTIIVYSLHIRQFYNWLDEGFHASKVDWIKGGKTSKRKLDETKLLMPSEIKKMVLMADRFRDKALIIGLYESGCRIRT